MYKNNISDMAGKNPITPKEIAAIANSIKVGDRIKKKVCRYGFYSGKFESEGKPRTCRVIAKCRNGVLVERKIRKDVYVKDFIAYANIAMERRKNGII